MIAKSPILQNKLFRRLLLSAVCCCTFVAATGLGQLPPAIETPATTNNTAVDLAQFAVATVKPVAATDGDPMIMRFSDDGPSFQKVSLAWVVEQAFSPEPTIYHPDDLILGLPGWTKSERYDIQAKVDDKDVPKWKAFSVSQRRLSLRSLLIARFDLQSHHEIRERPTYSLVVAKNGPKLRKAHPDEAHPISTPDSHGTSGGGESTVTPGTIVLQGSSLAALAKLLSSQGLSHSVVDNTGLTGLYDITLRWSPDDLDSSDTSLPSLFTALQEQLGLKLQYNRNPVDVIVIDHIEQPSAN